MDLAPLVAAAALPAAGWTAHTTVLARRLNAARRDPLTGLHTRTGFTRRAEHLLRTRPGRTTLVLIDLDDFKNTNDTHGHAAGDALLVAVAQRLDAWTGPLGICARLGGDEFAAVALDADTRIPGLRDALNSPVTHGNTLLDLSVSIGVQHPGRGSTLGAAIALADAAMYAAKPHRTRRR